MIKKENLLKVLLSLIIPTVILLWKPLGISFVQSAVLGALLLVITWWTTGIVDKTCASLFLLAVFLIFGTTPIEKVFQFPLSETFVMIVFSFLFSQGIANSKLADKLLQPLLFRFANSLWKLLLSVFLIQVVMIFVIPQPFSRVIIISLILTEYFNRISLNGRTKDVLLFWLYASSIHINMFLLRGDIILNNALLSIAGHPMGEVTWMQYMLVPSFLFYLLSAAGFLLVFRKDLKQFGIEGVQKAILPQKLDKKEAGQLILIAAVVVAWATESIHGISGTIIVIIGSLAMFLIGLLGKKDLKTVNIRLLIFLTAAFSIGAVLKTSGVSDVLFSRFVTLFPAEFSYYYVFLILVTAVVLHMFLGSNVTTMSVVVPGLLVIGSGIVKQEIMMFLIYVAVCAHFVIPFHNVILLIGDGNKHYKAETMLKFAPALTVAVILSIFLIYMNWWRFAGLL